MPLDPNRFRLGDKVVFTDPDGCTITYNQIKDTELNFVAVDGADKWISEFPDIVACPDDVIICGYAKAGTHWMWEVASMLIKRSSEYAKEIKETLMLEFAGKSVNDVASPRVLNSHVTLNYLPPDFITKKCKIIYLLRNPKDLAVSLFNHVCNLFPLYQYKGKWSGFLELYLEGKVDYGNIFNYMLEWEKDIAEHTDLPIHVWFYEDMKKDPEKETRKLASFLEVSVTDDVIKEIVDKCSFQKMKTAKAEFDTDEEKSCWMDGIPKMYRKGEVGDWKNWFTVAQNERFDARYKEKMQGSKLNFTYEL